MTEEAQGVREGPPPQSMKNNSRQWPRGCSLLQQKKKRREEERKEEKEGGKEGVTSAKYRLNKDCVFFFSLNKYTLTPCCILEMGFWNHPIILIESNISSGSLLEPRSYLPQSAVKRYERDVQLSLNPHSCPFHGSLCYSCTWKVVSESGLASSLRKCCLSIPWFRAWGQSATMRSVFMSSLR